MPINLNEIDTLVFDMEGVLFRCECPYPLAAKTLSELRSRGYRIAFLTNASSRRRSHFIEKLTKMGFECYENDIMTSSFATSQYIAKTR